MERRSLLASILIHAAALLLAAVGGTALVTLWHYFSERRKVRQEREAGITAEPVEPIDGDLPA